MNYRLISAAFLAVSLTGCSTYKGPMNFDVDVSNKDYMDVGACLYTKIFKHHHAGITFGETEEELDALVMLAITKENMPESQTIVIRRPIEEDFTSTYAKFGIYDYWVVKVSQNGSDVRVSMNHTDNRKMDFAYQMPVYVLPAFSEEFIPNCSAG
ncbi:hypothetical protein [Aestuariispira insulae]|uniref:Uncharacterized protein n=1 Tax=Aestuariispira insulae TaxID=1461337 RepID=A0A3D9HPZ9_9PROT|nr:hypothetical protein [Aestuariispira insulae]RED50986.1 hypothetical protein DFP90_104260 [Aestuariispira insulae]